MPNTKIIQKRSRLRDLGIIIGRFPPGRFNAITDIKGVRVGHTTLIQGHGKLVSKKSGPIRTGVTCIIPSDNIFLECVTGGSFILNGAGEVAGLMQVSEWGTIETPILLTNTFSVGICSDAVIHYMTEKHTQIGLGQDVIIPLVGECDDSWLNNITGNHLKIHHVLEAIKNATNGPVIEGNVGGGTGMITCDFKGGIGTSSRRITFDQSRYTLGVLVMSNFGDRKSLRVDGVPVGRHLLNKFEKTGIRIDNYGSIIAVIATDCPLSSHQLNRLCKRASLGIGRVGSYAAHSSGEIILAFSTANKIFREPAKNYYPIKGFPDNRMDPFYEAVIETTEEAILNAICMGTDMYGINDHFSPAIPLEELQLIMREYGKCSETLLQHPLLNRKYETPPSKTIVLSNENK